MTSAIFEFDGKKITIQCTNSQTMKEICQNFGTKAQIDISKHAFLYNGNQINMDLSYEKQANDTDKKRNQMNILVSEIIEEKSISDKIKEDLEKKGAEILKTHLDGRTYKEPKVNDWIQKIIEDFESYFSEKYSSYHLISFCSVCSKNTLYYAQNKFLCVLDKEYNSYAVFNNDDLHSVLYFFFFQNFISNPCPGLEPKIISYGNKCLYELFDERKYGNSLDDCCKNLNNKIVDNIFESDKRRRCLIITFAFKKPVKDFSYNYKLKSTYDMVRIIQTFVSTEIEVWSFLFVVSNDK
jgi:hypothetical protein